MTKKIKFTVGKMTTKTRSYESIADVLEETQGYYRIMRKGKFYQIPKVRVLKIWEE